MGPCIVTALIGEICGPVVNNCSWTEKGTTDVFLLVYSLGNIQIPEILSHNPTNAAWETALLLEETVETWSDGRSQEPHSRNLTQRTEDSPPVRVFILFFWVTERPMTRFPTSIHLKEKPVKFCQLVGMRNTRLNYLQQWISHPQCLVWVATLQRQKTKKGNSEMWNVNNKLNSYAGEEIVPVLLNLTLALRHFPRIYMKTAHLVQSPDSFWEKLDSLLILVHKQM